MSGRMIGKTGDGLEKRPGELPEGQGALPDGVVWSDVLYHFHTPKEAISKVDDVALEYIIVDVPTATSGLMIYARYDHGWWANPWNCKPVFRQILDRWIMPPW